MYSLLSDPTSSARTTQVLINDGGSTKYRRLTVGHNPENQHILEIEFTIDEAGDEQPSIVRKPSAAKR